MAEYLSDCKYKQYSQVFANFDFYSEGLISARSVYDILTSMQLQLTYDDTLQLIKQTGNSSKAFEKVTLSEFLTLMSIVIEDKDMNREIHQLFELFDTDKNKIINKDDFQTGFKHLETDLSKDQILTLIESTGKESFNLRQFRKYLLER